jgi:hypothetical protein
LKFWGLISGFLTHFLENFWVFGEIFEPWEEMETVKPIKELRTKGKGTG